MNATESIDEKTTRNYRNKSWPKVLKWNCILHYFSFWVCVELALFLNTHNHKNIDSYAWDLKELSHFWPPLAGFIHSDFSVEGLTIGSIRNQFIPSMLWLGADDGLISTMNCWTRRALQNSFDSFILSLSCAPKKQILYEKQFCYNFPRCWQ